MKLTSLAFIASLALVFAAPVLAHSHAASHVEMSMVVSGTVHIAPNGNVASYSLDHEDKLPAGVKKEIAKSVPAWVFSPVLVDGKRMAGVSQMYLRLVAKPVGHDNYAISISGARLGDRGNERNVWYSNGEPRPTPVYPIVARRSGVEGTVFLILRVNREGTVVKVGAEQVNLRQLRDPVRTKRIREAFAEASADAARAWTFTVPTEGALVGADHWDVQVPVVFRLSRFDGTHQPEPAYGKWQPYLPGPRRPVAWLGSDQVPAQGIDALPGGTLAAARQGRQLLTPLSGG